MFLSKLLALTGCVGASSQIYFDANQRSNGRDVEAGVSGSMEKDSFLNNLVANMTIPELVMQLHLMFADNVVGPNSDNGLYDFATRFAPDAGIGVVHDWYVTNSSQYNSVQKLNSKRSRLDIPLMQFGECLHGVGSFKQSMFPQSIGMAASFDTDTVYRVGRAIGSEARSIGIHACFSPVLDLGLDPRWGRGESWSSYPLWALLSLVQCKKLGAKI
ncbi:Periplasmic beta-glucosidase [Lachnellula arida]|uniref:Periplasmic beta-glucosidase n=1 Tax=Lachnellula arida TaxID=1316785 RepID=A0A8T9B3R1_9HELO|nr:Periplasmic beta-glucosidase [Lachnellula arida]